MKKNIYFKGYYGFKNLGDDIFCVTADWICNNIWRDATPIFIGEELPKLSSSAIINNKKSKILRKIQEVIVCINASCIIYFGGSVFTSKISGFRDLKYYLNKHSIFNSKIGTIGTSIGPFKSYEDYESIKGFLGKFKFINVRDYSSLSLAKKMNLSSKSAFCFDTAILIDEVYPSLKQNRVKNATDKLKIAVSLCHYERYINGDISLEYQREKSLLNFINKLIEKNSNIEEIVFFEFNGNKELGDLQIIKEFDSIVKRKIKTRIVEYTSDTESFCNKLSECDFLIGMRLHSAILAYALEIPFFLVEYHPKCTEFLNTINDKYRFDIVDGEQNLEIFQYLIQQRCIPGITRPDYFKDIIMEQIKNLNKIL